MTATEKLDAINAALTAGKSVYVRTMTKTTLIKQRHVDAWAKAGRQLLKTSGASLYMARGRHWDCIDYCQIEVR